MDQVCNGKMQGTDNACSPGGQGEVGIMYSSKVRYMCGHGDVFNKVKYMWV